MATIKPLDEELVLKAAQECGKIITCEEHSVIGGLGEAVCALLSEKCPTPVRRIGVNDEFGHSGPAADAAQAVRPERGAYRGGRQGLLRQISGRRPPVPPRDRGLLLGKNIIIAR